MSIATQRSLQLLRDEGFRPVQVVEHFNPHVKIRQDLFGFADILAVHPDKRITLAVQATMGHGNLWARRQKIEANDNARLCYRARWQIEIHGWVKKKIKRGGKAFRYVVKRESIHWAIAEFIKVEPESPKFALFGPGAT